MGRVSAELPRPIVTPVDFGGYDIEMLRVGALARTMLIRLKYLHICSPVYPVVVIRLVQLLHARHMRAYAIRAFVACGAYARIC